MFRNILIFCLLVGASVSDKFSYDGYKVWSVSPRTSEQISNLTKWEDMEGIDFWNSPNSNFDEINIMANPRIDAEFQKFLKSGNFEYRLLIDNIQKILEEEQKQQKSFEFRSDEENFESLNSKITHFWRAEEINRYLNQLATTHRNIATVETVGRTIEGRPIQSIQISLRGRVDGSRPIVFLDAGIHAREWAAPMAAVYIIHNLVVNAQNNGDILNNVDWIIIPLVNPDGYEFSHTQARMWRKNRRPHPNSRCFGVDGNRNYGYRWQPSNNICADTHSGSAGFSEAETQAVQRVLLRFRRSIRLYLSFHAFGNWVLYPWGYDRVRIANWQQHEEVGNLYARAVFENSRSRYTVGNSAILLYPAAGGSDDYAASVGVPLAYTIEVTRGSGFTLPANQISRVGSESLAGVRAAVRYVASHNWSN